MASNQLSLLVMITISAVIVTAYASLDADESIEFGYLGNEGPDKWGSLDPKFKKCSDGKAQSPINIEPSKVTQSETLKSLDRNYKFANATLVNNGFNVGIHFEEGAGVMSVDGKNYTLLQIHWHTPAEHKLDGRSYDAELQLLHKAEDGSIAIGAILYQVGNGDNLLARLHEKLEELGQEKCGSDEHAQIALGRVDTRQLRKCTRKYFKYNGSTTTPPCTENVIWLIFGKTRTISQQQIDLLEAPLGSAFKNNSRPVQPDNGREIELNYDMKKQN